MKFLASILNHPVSGFSLVAGQRGRRKLVKIDGLGEEELWNRLKPLLAL